MGWLARTVVPPFFFFSLLAASSAVVKTSRTSLGNLRCSIRRTKNSLKEMAILSFSLTLFLFPFALAGKVG